MKLQVPSKTSPSLVHVVNTRSRSCSCEGFDFRGTCSHLGEVLKHPHRYPPSGQPRSGLWMAGAGTYNPSEFVALLDEYHIAVIQVAGLLTGPEWGSVHMDKLCSHLGITQLKAGAAERVAVSRRTVVLLSGEYRWKKVDGIG